MSDLEAFKDKYIVANPASIREKLAAWAFEGAEDIQQVIYSLESMTCAGCFSPAPIHNDGMAREIARHWDEIDDALTVYREETGEAWAPREGQNFLTFLWFAYEWSAHELANEIHNEIELMQKTVELPPSIVDRPPETQRLPTPSQVIDNPKAHLPPERLNGHAIDGADSQIHTTNSQETKSHDR